MIIKPMLATAITKDQLYKYSYPHYIEPKIDGIRCLVHGEDSQTRSGKNIPNIYVRNKLVELGRMNPDYIIDGELIVDDFNSTTKGIMSHSGEPNFKFIIFDAIFCIGNNPQYECPMDYRYGDMRKLSLPSFCELIKRSIILTDIRGSLINSQVEDICSSYEGVIIRIYDGVYEGKRSKNLLKYKPFVDIDVTIVGMIEGTYNVNLPYIDELGHTKRSKAKDGLVKAGTVGTFIVKSEEFGEFEVGSFRLTKEELQEIWDNRNSYIGKIAKVKYLEFGMKDKPRNASFIGFRDEGDM